MANYHVFCDESHTDGHDYRVQGGIWADHKGLRIIRAEFTALRAEYPATREMKWNKVRGSKLSGSYRDLIRVFFDSPAAPHLSFKCLVVHKSDDPSATLDSHGRDLGFYKAYHLLLKYRLEPGCRYRIRLDKRKGPRATPESEVRECLNAEMCRWNPAAEVVSCVGLESHEDDLMQLADVLAGAVAWAWNGRPSAATAKVDLAGRIAAGLQWNDLTRETSGKAVKFNVWRYRPKKN